MKDADFSFDVPYSVEGIVFISVVILLMHHGPGVDSRVRCMEYHKGKLLFCSSHFPVLVTSPGSNHRP